MTNQPTTLELSLQHYQYDTEVEQFVSQHPMLQEVLVEAYEQIANHFGNNFHVILKLVYDPEIENLVHLVAYIWSERTVEAARSILSRFDRNWYLSLPLEIRSKLLFTIRSRR